MRRKLPTIYAILLILLWVGGSLLVFSLAWQMGVRKMMGSILGFVLGFGLSPIVHELGHLFFGWRMNMECVYIKCSCLKVYTKNGKRHFGLASPFSKDETQMVPTKSGNMEKRMTVYALGGLIFGAAFLLIVIAAALICHAFGHAEFALWGIVPYAAYLLLVNAVPFEYASGKTDTYVCLGIKKGYDAEKTMISALKIQGQLYEGKSFAEIDERLYFDLPQLCEDEPMFAVILDLRYSYYLEKGEMEKAADCINRLAYVQAYLPPVQVEKIAAELMYMHVMNGDLARAEECGDMCREFLKGNTVTAKRVLIAYSAAYGRSDTVAALLKQAKRCLDDERVAGIRKFEETLIERVALV